MNKAIYLHSNGKLIEKPEIVYKNDSQFTEVIFRKFKDKEHPRVDIIIKESK